MLERTGDIFTEQAGAIVIPINWVTKKSRVPWFEGDGLHDVAVMGAGVAKRAAEIYPWLPSFLGPYIAKLPDRPYALRLGTAGDKSLCLVPTKRDWRNPSDLDLIEDGMRYIAVLADLYDWEVVAMPKVGCGLGKLEWSVVKERLDPILDDRFVVLTPE